MYKSVPTTLQMQAADCGAASLKMVLDFYEIRYSLEEIRTSIGIGRDGSTIGDIRRAAASLNFPMEAQRIDKDTLINSSPPFIIWWNSNHFVVYEGFKNSRFFINDPAIGPRSFSETDFFSSFTGVVIFPTNRKSSVRYKSKNIKSTTNILLDLFKQYEINIILVAILAIVSVIPTIILSQITSYFIDSVIGQANIIAAIPLVWLVFLLSGLIALLNYLSFSIAARTVFASATIKSIEFLRAITSRNYAWFSNRQSTELSTRLAIPSTQINSFIYDVITELSSLTSGIIITLVLLLSCFPLGLFTASVLIITFTIAYKISKSIDCENRLVSIESGKQQGLSLLTLSEIFLVRTSGLETQRYSTWAGYYTNFVNAQYAVSNSLNIIGLVSRGAFYILNIGLIIIGPLLIINHSLSLGGFISSSYLLGLVTSSVVSIPTLLSSIQDVLSPVDRLRDVYEAVPDVNSSHNWDNLSSKTTQDNTIHTIDFDTLDLDNLCFQFTPQNIVFTNINQKIPAKGLIRISGNPGSGKSILLSLIANLHKPTSGSVNWLLSKNNNDAASNIQPKITYLSQKPTIIDGTVLDNISYGNTNIPHSALIKAAQNVNLTSSYYASSGLQLTTQLKFGGDNISIKTIQEIIFARAFASHSDDVLLLDYFFSDLDNETVAQYLLALRNKYKSVFFVSPHEAHDSISEFIFNLS